MFGQMQLNVCVIDMLANCHADEIALSVSVYWHVLINKNILTPFYINNNFCVKA